jgi:hypothetical protein
MGVGNFLKNKMEKLRYQNKKFNLNERSYVSNLWKEQIEIYGQEVFYYFNKAELKDMHRLYGEDQSIGFAKPKPLIILCTMNNDAYLLSKFGIIADSDLAGVIHPHHFKALFGDKFPKAGDLLELTEFGEDRLEFPDRGANVFELTEVRDEFEYNPLGWHVVWSWKATRYNFSDEVGSPGGGVGNNPIDDNDIIEDAAKENFDYESENPCSNNSVYGDY